MKNVKGTTLMELILTIIIIGILVLIIAPKIKIGGSNLDCALKLLITHLRYAQNLAINRQQTFGVEFDLNNNKYTVYQGSIGNPVKDPHKIQDDLIVDFDTYPNLKGVSLSSAQFPTPATDWVNFDSLGAPTSGGTVVLSYGGNNKTMEIHPSTGSVEIQ